MKQTKNSKTDLGQDIGIVALSVIVAIVLLKTDVLVNILTSSQELEIIGSLIAGIFFTSIFTVAPAVVTLGEIAQSYSVFWTAFFGAAGALIGDLIIFHFIKDRLSVHLIVLLKQQSGLKRLKTLLRWRFFKWFTFLVGCIIIASPLPDELGVSLLGFSKTDTSWFILLSLTFNFLGILLIGIVARQ